MQILRPLYLAGIGTLGLIGACLAQTPGGQPSSAAKTCERSLTPYEEAILRNPFPSEVASQRLMQNLIVREQNRRRTEALPEAQRPKNPDNGGMGWVVSDAEYWRRIPPEARAIPTDWSGLPGMRFTNTQLGGERQIRLCIQGEYDLWLLSDPLHELRAFISVHRPTRRVWFMEITQQENGAWVPKQAKDHCYSCHPSGPRVIRPLAEAGLDRDRLARFNRRILSYGACDFGDSVDSRTRGKPYADERCSGCHNGVDRGKLYAIHLRPIQFKREQEETMPPEE
jgi:hypothetical protein